MISFDNGEIRRCDGCDVVLDGDIRKYKVSAGDGESWQLCLDCQNKHSCERCGEYADTLKTNRVGHPRDA